MSTNKKMEILSNIIKTLSQIKYEISGTKFGLPISRRQGMKYEDVFAFKIIKAIKSAISDNYQGLTKPFLYITSNPNDGFDREKLISFIDNEIDILNEMEVVDDQKIQNYFNKFTFRILELSKSC